MENMKESINQKLNLIASIITIINFLYSLIIVNSSTQNPIPPIPSQALPIGLIIIALLETFLSAGFGWLIVKFAEKGHGIPFILVIVVALVSAWTTMFNIQWLIIQGSANGIGAGIILFLMSAMFCGLACYFITIHSVGKEYKQLNTNKMVSVNNGDQLIGWQIVTFVVMYIFVMSSQPYT